MTKLYSNQPIDKYTNQGTGLTYKLNIGVKLHKLVL